MEKPRKKLPVPLRPSNHTHTRVIKDHRRKIEDRDTMQMLLEVARVKGRYHEGRFDDEGE
jgi:hypothetical protein